MRHTPAGQVAHTHLPGWPHRARRGVARQVGDPMTLLKPALTVVSRKYLLKARLTTHAWHANFRATTVISVNHTVKDKCIELRVSTSKAGGLGWSVLGGPARWDRVWRGKQGARLATHTSCVQALKACVHIVTDDATCLTVAAVGCHSVPHHVSHAHVSAVAGHDHHDSLADRSRPAQATSFATHCK